MNKLGLESCRTVQEIAKEIWRQSYEISRLNEDDYGRYEDRDRLYGFYLKPIKSVINTPFDIYYKVCSDSYIKIINEWEEGRRYDGALMGYEVMLNWLDGKYNFKYIPHTCEEFIEMIFDERAEEITKYLVGVLQRLTRNALYCSKTKSSISRTKYYTHDATSTYYTDIIEVDIDRPYEYSEGFEVNSHKIVDEFLLKNNKSKSTSIKSVEDELFGVNEEEDGIYKYLYNNLLSDINRRSVDSNKVDNNRNYFIRKRLIERTERFNALTLDNQKVKFGGNFLDFGYNFMLLDEVHKFMTLKKVLNKNNATSNILTDCIYELDVEIIKQFVYMLKNEIKEEVRVYCKSKNFKLIIDCILDEYFVQQSKLKEIYLFNETDRIEKIRIVEEYIKSVERKDGTLSVAEINKIFAYCEKVYQLRLELRYKKGEIKQLQFKLDMMEQLGFRFVEIGDRVRKTYKCKNIS